MSNKTARTEKRPFTLEQVCRALEQLGREIYAPGNAEEEEICIDIGINSKGIGWLSDDTGVIYNFDSPKELETFLTSNQRTRLGLVKLSTRKRYGKQDSEEES